jgi:hypothetical protein
MILDVQITKSDFIFDFGDFQIETPKDYIDEVVALEWYNNCLMIETPDNMESIGLFHLLFGEYPYYAPCDYTLRGKESLTKKELRNYLNSVENVRWVQ